MSRFSPLLAWCLAPILLADAPAAGEPPRSIQCRDQGSYIGNLISPVFTLVINGPQDRTWKYEYSDNLSGTANPPRTVKATGTYELVDDLALFTGTLTQSDEGGGQETRQTIRFGLNHGFPAGQVQFNRFFPAADGKLHYHQKWFRAKGQEWLPVEERRLAIAGTAPAATAESWEVTYRGERVRWDERGQATVEKVDDRVVYRRGQGGVFVHESRPERRWLPAEVAVQVRDGRLESVTLGYGAIGQLRGFHPQHALPPSP
jgi:hypothetical protein